MPSCRVWGCCWGSRTPLLHCRLWTQLFRMLLLLLSLLSLVSLLWLLLPLLCLLALLLLLLPLRLLLNRLPLWRNSDLRRRGWLCCCALLLLLILLPHCLLGRSSLHRMLGASLPLAIGSRARSSSCAL